MLDLPTNDLDIALTTASGHAFALGFVDFLKTCGVPTTTVGKVAANPDQSKHLETGTTRIMGLECDFVGLRSETYADSRIPTTIRLGTPLEDASRRDLTINALFYNVHNQQVEDHTGLGLDDLRDKVARTPLPPRQTFQDDPLRVLRCIRFASRLDLTISPEVQAAIQQKDIQVCDLPRVDRVDRAIDRVADKGLKRTSGHGGHQNDDQAAVARLVPHRLAQPSLVNFHVSSRSTALRRSCSRKCPSPHFESLFKRLSRRGPVARGGTRTFSRSFRHGKRQQTVACGVRGHSRWSQGMHTTLHRAGCFIGDLMADRPAVHRHQEFGLKPVCGM